MGCEEGRQRTRGGKEAGEQPGEDCFPRQRGMFISGYQSSFVEDSLTHTHVTYPDKTDVWVERQSVPLIAFP